MNPNDKFRHIQGNKVISVANLPAHFCVKDPEEYRRDMHDMLVEMGICTKCHDHKPCGCEPMGKCPNCLTDNFDLDARVCYSCDYDEKHDPNYNPDQAPPHNDTQDITNGNYLKGRKSCINCGSPNTAQGGFCSKSCKAIYIGEA